MHSVLFEFPLPRVDLGPIHIGPVPIHAYGSMLAIAFMVAFVGLLMLVRKTKAFDPERVVDITLWVLLSGVAGARLLYVLLNYRSEYAGNPVEILYVWRGGLAFHGGIIGALVAGLIWARSMRVSFGAVADNVAPMAAIGYAITKVGCFLNGCCHGSPVVSSVPWACQFPVQPGDLNVLTPLSHPVQIYDSLLNVGVFLFLLWFLLRRRRWHGQVFLWWLILYSVTRIVTDWFRYYGDNPLYSTADPLPGLTGLPVINAITQAQFGSVATTCAAAAGLIAGRKLTTEDRVDLKILPAFMVGSVPPMIFLCLWLRAYASTDAGRTRDTFIGVLYVAVAALLCALYPALARRLPFTPTRWSPPSDEDEDAGSEVAGEAAGGSVEAGEDEPAIGDTVDSDEPDGTKGIS